LFVALLVCLGTSEVARAASATGECCTSSLLRAGDQMWLVRSPCELDCANVAQSTAQLTAAQYLPTEHCGRWETASVAGLLAVAADDAKRDTTQPITVIFLHGNDTDEPTAIDMSWTVYRHLAVAAGERPLRMICWSWPSERELRRLRRDFQIKADRSDLVGYQVAWLVDQMPDDSLVSLVGYSYGSRAASAALDTLAGGTAAGTALRKPGERGRAHVRALLIAAAFDNDWLAPGHCHGKALLAADRLVVTVNPCDRVLRFYSRLYGRGGAEALGYTGAVGIGGHGMAVQRLVEVNVSSTVGKSHKWGNYIHSSQVIGLLQNDALFRD
jgi:pimeloyl-ACP methyl ester carboxylesterase